MYRIILAVCIALLGTGVSWARKTVVWDSPAIGYGTHNGDGFFNPSLDVTRVELKAIERYLGVKSFPTYKLFDREGNLLDFKVDARSLDGLENLLRQF